MIDSNILGVIGRAAELTDEDVVLEVGGGLGVLSEYLAERVAHVHVIELDERLRDALRDATDSHENLSVHWGDAMQLDIAAFEPSPRKLVANCISQPSGDRSSFGRAMIPALFTRMCSASRQLITNCLTDD